MDSGLRPRLSASVRSQMSSSYRSLSNLGDVVKKVRLGSNYEKKHVEDNRTPEERRRGALLETKKKLKEFVYMSIPELLSKLGTDGTQGLKSEDAAVRLQQHGRNELPKEPPEPIWRMILAQLSDLLVLMLLVAAIVAIGLQHYESGVFIILIVTANAALGVYQERRAGAALDALESLSSSRAEIIRDGKRVEVDSAELVPGDLVVLDVGKKVPADIRLIDSSDLYSSEMPLTGESDPVKKNFEFLPARPNEDAPAPISIVTTDDANKSVKLDKIDEKSGKVAPAENKAKEEEKLTDANMVYMGCDVTEGRGRGIVCKTGLETKVGEIAKLLKTAEEESSPLQTKLHSLGVKLGIASLVISLVVFVVGVTTGAGVDHNSSQPAVLQMLLIAVSLTVAAVPEGLPACVTITLSVGMKEMVKRNALIRNLHSVETLGSASVICTDKTGTLTRGIMTATRLWFRFEDFKITGTGYDPEGNFFPANIDDRDTEAINRAVVDLRREGNLFALPLVVAALCSNASLQRKDTSKDEQKENKEAKEQWECVGNPTERPLVVAAAKAGLRTDDLNKRFPRIKENPFTSARKVMSVLVDVNGDTAYFPRTAKYAACVKGAPNVIVQKCTGIADRGSVRPLTPEDSQRIMTQIDAYSDQALRVIAVAYQPFASKPDSDKPDVLEKELIFCGLLAVMDPPRVEVAPAISRAGNAGIRVVMITGDYVKTAKAIAQNIGILPPNSPPEKAVDCQVLRELDAKEEALMNRMKELETQKQKSSKEYQDAVAGVEALKKEVDKITAVADVFARAKPADKITIVRSLQRQGHVASMTGDGVNDAPALKKADIGVAMGITGTDVAKAAADMVLIDDNFVCIVSAIEQGRTLYNNIQKFVFYLLSTNVSEVMFILIAVLIKYQSPLVPIQILWLNLTTDGAPAVALAVEKMEPGIMEEGPRPKNESIIEKVMMTGIVIQNITLTSCTLFAYIIGLYFETGQISPSYNYTPSQIARARSMCILYIVFAELARAYTSRSLRCAIWNIGFFSNRWMQYACSVSVLATIFVANVPWLMDEVFEMEYLTGKQWGFVFGFCLVPAAIDEFTKFIYRQIGFGIRPKAKRVSGVADYVPVVVPLEYQEPTKK